MVFTFLVATNSFAQDFNPNTDCVNGCTAKDIKKITAYLVSPIAPNNAFPASFTCNSGDDVTVKLAMELTTSTGRLGIYIYANIRNSTTNAIIGNVSECFVNAQLGVSPVTKLVFNKELKWGCGTSIKLTDVYIGWGTGNSDFCEDSPLPRCPATTSKCFALKPGEYIPIVIPTATPASLTQCSTTPGGTTAVFDLTSLNTTVAGGQPNVNVTWFSNLILLNQINTNPSPAAYPSASATVYAKVTSTISPYPYSSVAVTLTVNTTPAGTDTSQTLCSSTAGGTTASFDLTSKNTTVVGSSGATVLGWYETYSAGVFSNPISPANAYVSGNKTVYAKLSGTGGCIGVATNVLTVNTTPAGTDTSQTLCSSTAGGTTASFDLTSKDATVVGASGSTVLGWYETYSAGVFSNEIASPATYESGSKTVYAKLSGTGGCIGVANNVLTVNATPAGTDTSQTLCSSTAGGSTASFDLTSKNTAVVGGLGASVLGWYETYSAGAFSNLISPANAYVSGNKTVYAKLSGTGGCIGVANNVLTVNTTPAGTDTSQTLCSSSAGGTTASFDLTSKNTAVVGGLGASVLGWYETYSAGAFSNPISPANAYVSGNKTVYAKLSGTGGCIGLANNVLTVNTTPAGTDTSQTLCSSTAGGTTASFDLTSKNTAVVGTSGATVLGWYETYSAGTFSNPISSANAYVSGNKTVYAKLSGTGGCIGVANNVLTVNATPDAPSLIITQPSLCSSTGSITILSPTGDGYKYSIDNGDHWQLETLFENLVAGSNPSIIVKSPQGCISIPSSTCPPSPTIGGKTVNPDIKITSKIAAVEETSTTSKTETAGFDAYPVPFKDQLTIKYNFDYMSDVKIEVFNAQGISILSKTDHNSYLNKEVTLELHANKDQEQLYLVKVTTNRGSSVKKVMSSK